MKRLFSVSLLLFSFACFTHATDGNDPPKDEWDNIPPLGHGNSTVQKEQKEKVNMTELSNSISKTLQNQVGVEGGNHAPPAPPHQSESFKKRAAILQ